MDMEAINFDSTRVEAQVRSKELVDSLQGDDSLIVFAIRHEDDGGIAVNGASSYALSNAFDVLMAMQSVQIDILRAVEKEDAMAAQSMKIQMMLSFAEELDNGGNQ